MTQAKSSRARAKDAATSEKTQGIAVGQLRSLVQRIERLEDEKSALTADIREVYAEAKSNGFEPKIIRQVVRLRKLDKEDRQEQEALRDLYLGALGE